MANRIDDLGWNCKWVSHLGCLKGCLDHLGLDISDAWLYGATGHAFVLNIHPELCPSGPTAWKAEAVHRLGRSVGYAPAVVLGFGQEDDLRRKQELAWAATRAAIDQGLPCFGWELNIPEYYVIYGYDDVGYLYKGPGCDPGAGPKAWSSIGDSEIGVLEMYVIKPGPPAPDMDVVTEALRFAIDYAEDPSPWTFEGYAGALAGYDVWIESLRKGTADGLGTAYNAAVWSECRSYAGEFLEEARTRLPNEHGNSLLAAARSYRAAAEALGEVADTFPFVHGPGRAPEQAMADNVRDPDRKASAVAALSEARTAEADGLHDLAAFVDALGPGRGTR